MCGVWSSDEANWAAQDNTLFLEDYYQDLERLFVPEVVLDTLYQMVDEHPGIMLSDLQTAADTISADLINIAIAKHALYVDLATYRLSEPWRTPVFRNRHLARAYQKGATQDEKIVAPSRDLTSSITLEGRELLERASDVDLATAVFRNRVIHPDHYRDVEQIQIARV